MSRAGQIYKTGDQRCAIRFLDSTARQLPDQSGYFNLKIYQFKAEYYYRHELTDSNNLYIDSIVYAFETYHLAQDYPAEYGNALNNKANRYYELNELNKAFEFYYKSRLVAMSNKDTCLFGDQSYHLGMVTYRQEKYADAIAHFKDAMLETLVCKSDSSKLRAVYCREQELRNNIALAFSHLSENDSAAYYYILDLDYIRDNSPKYDHTAEEKKYSEIATGVICGNLAKTFISLNKYDSARILLNRSIEINSRPGYENNDAILAQMQLAELFYKTNDLPNTLSTLHLLQPKLDSSQVNNASIRWNHLMYQYYAATGAAAPALKYLEAYTKLKDTQEQQSRSLKKTDYDQLFKNQENQFQINMLKKDNQVNKLYFLVTLALGGIAVLIIIMVYINYRRSVRNVKTLTLLNEQINQQKAQLEATTKEVISSNQDKDRILHVVAHDLRSPLSGIMMIGTMLAEEEKDDSKREMLDMQVKASQTLLTLTGELLEFSGTQQNATESREVIDLNEIGRQVSGLLQFKASEKHQTIKLHPATAPLKIFARKEKINRVLSNLVTNAIKFSPEQSAIELTLSAGQGNAVIVVRDHGIGIPEKSLPLIFDSFTTAKRYGTSGESSFGLGLSICKQIVEESGGTIWVESEEGKGTSFYIKLPLAS